MQYSRKGFWLTTVAAWSVMAVFLVLVFWLRPEPPRPRPIIGLLAVAVSFIVVTLAIRAFFYRDEIQRQNGMRCVYFGFPIGSVIAGALTVSIFIFRHPAPRAFINFMLPLTPHARPPLPGDFFRMGFAVGLLTLAFAQVIGALLMRAFLSLPKRGS
jgi:hypothetical protein